MVVERRTLWMGAGVLVVTAVVIALWAGGDNPTATSDPVRRPARGQPGTRGNASDDGPVDVVKLAELKTIRVEPVDAGRNPFRFQARRAEPDPDAPPIQKPGRPENVTPAVPLEPPKPLTPPGPPPPPPITVKLFGIAEQGGRKVAMLTDGRDPTAGKEGQIVYGQYLIVKIGQESVEMSYPDGRGRQTIRLTGQ